MAGQEQKSGRRLEGWKEIAAYLNRRPRTVQGWEKEFGLPIFRLQGRTYADCGELDRWLAEHKTVTAAAVASEEPVAAGRGWMWWGVAGVALLLMAGLYWWQRAGAAVAYAVQGKTLTMRDRDGREVWRYELPTAPPEEKRGEHTAARGTFADVDGDGRQEFLYRYWPTDLGKENSGVFCFREDGTVRWMFRPGKALAMENGGLVTELYRAEQVGLLAKARPDGGRVVVMSNHSWDWPGQMAVLTAEGVEVEEYWHPGWLFSMVVTDVDGDGAEEILAGGVNNAYGDGEGHGATLVVLDARDVRGQGSVPAGYQLRVKGVPTGREKRVLLFPEFARNTNANYYCHVAQVRTAGKGGVELVISQGFGEEIYGYPYAHVQLDGELRVRRVLPGARLAELLDATLRVNERTPAARGELYRRAVGKARGL